MALAQQVVGNDAAQYPADEAADSRQRGNDARLEDGHAALLNQVHREPGQEEVGDAVDAVLAEVDTQHHAVGQQLANVIPLGAAAGCFLRAFTLVLIQIDQRAIAGNVLQFGLVDHRVVARAVDDLHPDHREQDTDCAHDHEYVLPAVGVDDPAHQRSEQNGGEILRRVEDRRGRAALGGREPGGDDAGVAREGRRFSQPDQKAQHEQRDDGGGNAELTHIALQQGEQRPGENAHGVDFLRPETVEQPATGDLTGHVGPAKCGKDIAQSDRSNAKVFLDAGTSDSDGGTVGVVDRGDQKQHQQNQIADVRRLGLLHGRAPTDYFFTRVKLFLGVALQAPWQCRGDDSYHL
ncbi:hypothetical protein ALP58_05658 [Pseudomonas savastanoi]|uniref:Uncharacterized protein n=1 Tax=Pseudomonas savastanoi TaxID=29438 RepID=A0A3M5GFE3_PSESS|nr:hypothetical protein ALP58_05658 [Pseudomonas savastanoi]